MCLFSIVIPVYNRENVIRATIKSVLNQTYKNYEIIIVDDGSIDKTKTIIQKYLFDERIKYYYKSNSGVSLTRNYGASLAKGDYLIFLDSDDFLHDNYLSKFQEALDNYNAQYVSCGFVKNDTYGNSEPNTAPAIMPIYNNVKGNFLAGTFAISKELFLKVGMYDTNLTFSENTELFIRVTNSKEPIDSIFINEALITINYDRTHNKQQYYRPRIINSTEYILKKHKDVFRKDINTFKNYLKVLSFNYFKAGNYFMAASRFVVYLKYRLLVAVN